jgi:hypothetical protein
MKPETAENWIDYFLNKENNTPIDMPQGDMTQWQSWWDNVKTGDVQMPPHTTLSSITEKHSEPITPIMPTEMKIPMESPKIKKRFIMPPEIKEKKVREPTTGGLLW